MNEDNFINTRYLLALIYYRISNYPKAYEALRTLIDSFSEEEKSQNIHLVCSRDYVYFKAKKLNNNEIFSTLRYIYKEELLYDVINDLENKIDVFKYQNFPTCFNCKDCKIIHDCFYFDVLRFVKKIQEKHKNNRINQDNLKWVSEFVNCKSTYCHSNVN